MYFAALLTITTYRLLYGHSPFVPFHAKAQAKGWKTLSMACGHDAMLDMPNELARVLLNTLEIPSNHA